MNAQPTADPTLDPERPARGGLLSLRVKFLGAIGAGVLASGIVAGTAFMGLGSVTASADALSSGNLKQAELVSGIDGNLTRVDINILRMLAVGGKDNIAGWKAENDTRFVVIDGLLAKLDASEQTPAEAKTLKHLEASFDAMRSGMKKQVTAIEAGDPVGAAAINAQYVKDPANAAYADLTTLAALNAKQSALQVGVGHRAQSSARAWVLAAFFGGALLAFALGLQIVRSVLKRLGRVQTSLEAMATGDLTVSPGTTSGDEVARMAAALVGAQNGVKSMISSVATAATQLSSEVRTLSATSAQIATTAGRTSAQTQEMSASAGQVSSNVQIVAAGSSEMDASIREIAQNTNRAAEVAREAVAAAEATTATVTKLGDSSAQIATVVQVINTIAAQTNLLALNATIEAARAGEAGKGFAVVAGEVKELAQETAKATEDISRRVQAIQADSVSASAAIEEIAGIIERISDSQVAIASAVEEQTATTNEMARNVSEASAGSVRIASDVAEVAAAAEATTLDATASEAAAVELLRMSSELQRLVGQFRC